MLCKLSYFFINICQYWTNIGMSLSFTQSWISLFGVFFFFHWAFAVHSGIDFAVNYTVYVIHFSQNLAKISFFRCNIFNSIRVSDRPMISYDVIYLGHSLCIGTQHRDLEVYRMSSLLVLKHKPLFNCICHVFPQFFCMNLNSPCVQAFKPFVLFCPPERAQCKP